MTCVKVIKSTYMMFVSFCLFYPFVHVDKVQDTVVQDTVAGKPVASFLTKKGKKRKKLNLPLQDKWTRKEK